MIEAKNKAEEFISKFYEDDDFENNKELASAIIEKHFEKIYKNPMLFEYADKNLINNKAMVYKISSEILKRTYEEGVNEASLNECIDEVLEEVRAKEEHDIVVDNYGMMVIIIDFYNDERKIIHEVEEEELAKQKPLYVEARKYMEAYYIHIGKTEDDAMNLSSSIMKKYYDFVPKHYQKTLTNLHIQSAVMQKLVINTLANMEMDLENEELDTIAITRIIREVNSNIIDKDSVKHLGIVIIVIDEYFSNKRKSNAMTFIRRFYDEDDFAEASELSTNITKKYFAHVITSKELKNTNAHKMIKNKPLTTSIMEVIIIDCGYRDVNETILLECINEVFEEIDDKELDDHTISRYAIVMIILDFYIDSIKELSNNGEVI